MVGIVPPPPPNISNVLGQEFSILRSKWVLASGLTGSSCLNLGESIAGAETWPPGTGLAEAGEVGGGGAVRSPRACGGGESPDRHGCYYFSPWASLPFRSEIWSERGGCLSRPRGTHAIRRRQQPGLRGLRGAADPGRAPAGLTVNAAGVGGRPAVPLGTISPPVSAFFPSQHPCVGAPGSESQGLSCGLRCRCRGRPPNSSRPR